MENKTSQTPLMRQYWDIKSLHADKILLFRMGDFYEMFFDDAVKAAPILGIALTSRNKKAQDETPMCGVPHHSIAGPINKLLKQGLKVAICDQIEDPKTAKGIVKRAVTRILTPGMVYDTSTLDAYVANYIVSYDQNTLACVDSSTGEAFYFANIDEDNIRRLLGILPVVEIVTASAVAAEWPVTYSVHSEGVDSCDRLLSYIRSLGGAEAVQMIKPFEKRELDGRMPLSSLALRHLEIFYTYKGEGAGSLFHAVDRTKTSVGARLLRSRMQFPLTNWLQINQRLDEIDRWKNESSLLVRVRDILSHVGDIERRLTRIAWPQCNVRDLQSLSSSLRASKSALQIAQKEFPPALSELMNLIDTSFVIDAPLSVRQGHIINKGVDPVLDELIELSTDSQSLLQQMEQRERELTGISSLKIRYNNVFGYYIEITNTHKDKVPARYLRKQTLAAAERYCTDELVELEKKVLSAQSRRAELEFEIFEQLRKRTLSLSAELLSVSTQIGELDLATSLAWLAIENKYCRPKLGEKRLQIKSSRHPVVEQVVKKAFVANDIEIEPGGCILLTGPNMAGKSTIMRQVALTVLLAQMGSFVPAASAQLPIFDQIFTRIGASDQLSEGLSTFMVEMKEAAEILQKSTAQSLVILDEIGRGTSTYDGLSLAQAILEFILQSKSCMTLFATHYHELTSLQENFQGLRNAHMQVVEQGGEIRFLHTLMNGPAMKSYGIHVAKLAGLPKSVLDRAQKLLRQNEDQRGEFSQDQQLSLGALVSLNEDYDQQDIKALVEEIKKYPVMQKSPLEALSQIAVWQDKADKI